MFEIVQEVFFLSFFLSLVAFLFSFSIAYLVNLFISFEQERVLKEKWMWDVILDLHTLFASSSVTVFGAFKSFDKHKRGQV
jgi:hypothetical protein